MKRTRRGKSDNLDTLRTLMDEHDLTAQDVAELVCCKRQTVYNWRAGRPVPDYVVKMLQIEFAS